MNIPAFLSHSTQFANYLFLFAYNFLMDSPIFTIFGMKIDIEN